MATEAKIPVISYRDLSGQECTELAPALQKAGMTIAYTHLADPVVAEVDGKIVGFCFAQLIPHWEPLWVEREWRGMGIAEELAKRALEKITKTGAQKFCCITTSAFAEKLAREAGMREVEGKLFVKD